MIVGHSLDWTGLVEEHMAAGVTVWGTSKPVWISALTYVLPDSYMGQDDGSGCVLTAAQTRRRNARCS